ncbi:hypothetical protein Leryth_015154 [Lithospermum erythrorhizon]|nr:hypothetical protein Leryth_015154 [Lithospermum erythrorhizon]
MQRQSLGSPASKHHHLLLSSAAIKDTTTTSPLASPCPPQNEPDEIKNQKKLLHKRPPERFIHAIPILTMLCFLILYLSSHDPSQLEMAMFNGIKTTQNPIDNIDEIEPLMEIKKGDILSIRSLRNLQEIDKEEGVSASNYQQLHRKIGDF